MVQTTHLTYIDLNSLVCLYIYLIIMLKFQEKKITPLTPLIQNYFQTCRTKNELNEFSSQNELNLVVIEKGQVLCITDMKHSIQATRSKIGLQKNHPFCRQMNNFYSIVDRSWISFNAKLQDLTQTSEYPHAYQPCFYFKKQYEDYCKQRPSLEHKLQCEMIKVKKWSFRIVNVSQSGYYGLVMELLDFRYTGEKSIQNVINVTSIMYEKIVKSKLESVRLQDVRRIYSKAEDKKHPWSLFFYCRNINLNPRQKKKLNNIIVVDKDQKMLKYDTQRKTHFVNFGEMEETSSLQFPLNSKQIDQSRIKKINIQNMQVLFNKITQPLYVEPVDMKMNEEGQLWSSDEQEEQKRQNNSQIIADSDDQRSQSSDNQEDPLRNLYIKQFKDLKIL